MARFWIILIVLGNCPSFGLDLGVVIVIALRMP
jgi:hypothetical protein